MARRKHKRFLPGGAQVSVASSGPVSSGPVSSEEGTSEPERAEPVASQSEQVEPVASEPPASDPPNSPAQSGPAPADNATRELVAEDFQTIAPSLSEPGPHGPQPRDSLDSWVGRVLSNGYRLDERLGSGGVGSVYRGTQLRLERSVAIKVLHEGLHASFTARFEREAMALAALRHPNIVAVTDYGVDDGMPFLVMELLDGETLHYRLTQGLLPPKRVFELARELLRALSYVHAQGLVHRDLKPGNVFLEKLPHGEQRLRLLDFGLAKFVDGSGDRGEPVTRHGDIVGTPSYMSPEQVVGDAVDARTDTYSAGVVLYQMLAGRPPYEGEPAELLKSHLVAPVPTLGQKRKGVTVRPELEAFIARALAKPRDARFQTATEMLSALEAIPEPWLLPPPALAPEQATIEEEADLVPTIPSPSADPARIEAYLAGIRAAQKPAKRRRWVMPVLVLALGAVVALAVLQWRRTVSPVERESARAIERQQPKSVSAEPIATVPATVEREQAAQPVEPAPTTAPMAVVAAELPSTLEPSAAGALAVAAEPIAGQPVAVEPVAGAAAAAEPVAGSAAPAELAEAPAPSAAPPIKNPWKQGVPRALAAARKAALAGEPGSERMILALRRYNRESGADTRGHLVLARLYRNRKWRDDALHQYELAYQLDPNVRGAPEMLEGLLPTVRRPVLS